MANMMESIKDLKYAVVILTIVCIVLLAMNLETRDRITKAETINTIILRGGYITAWHYGEDGVNIETCDISLIRYHPSVLTICFGCGEINSMEVMETWNYTVRVSDLKILSSEYTCVGFCPECNELMPVNIMTL